MATEPASAQQSDTTPDSGPDPRQAPAGRRREAFTWTVVALLPVSVLAALLVLHLMAASSAAATGGCGGG